MMDKTTDLVFCCLMLWKIYFSTANSILITTTTTTGPDVRFNNNASGASTIKSEQSTKPDNLIKVSIDLTSITLIQSHSAGLEESNSRTQTATTFLKATPHLIERNGTIISTSFLETSKMILRKTTVTSEISLIQIPSLSENVMMEKTSIKSTLQATRAELQQKPLHSTLSFMATSSSMFSVVISSTMNLKGSFTTSHKLPDSVSHVERKANHTFSSSSLLNSTSTSRIRKLDNNVTLSSAVSISYTDSQFHTLTPSYNSISQFTSFVNEEKIIPSTKIMQPSFSRLHSNDTISTLTVKPHMTLNSTTFLNKSSTTFPIVSLKTTSMAGVSSVLEDAMAIQPTKLFSPFKMESTSMLLREGVILPSKSTSSERIFTSSVHPTKRATNGNGDLTKKQSNANVVPAWVAIVSGIGAFAAIMTIVIVICKYIKWYVVRCCRNKDHGDYSLWISNLELQPITSRNAEVLT